MVLLGAIVLTGCMGVGVQRVGSAAAARARVDGVADLTALAAVSGGSGAGGQVALANRADVTSSVQHGDIVVVRVEAGGVAATAAARPSR